MLNIHTKLIALSRDVILLNKTYGEYVSRKDTTKANSYILQEKDNSNKYSYVKIHPINAALKIVVVSNHKYECP